MGAEFLERRPGEGAGSEEGQEVVESLPVGPPGVLGRHGVQHEGFEAGDELAGAAPGGWAPVSPPHRIGNQAGQLAFLPPPPEPAAAPTFLNYPPDDPVR